MSSSHEVDVGIFCPNQYKPCIFLAYHPGQTHNNTNLLVGVYSKHRHYVCGALCLRYWRQSDKFHKRAIWKWRSQMLCRNDHSISQNFCQNVICLSQLENSFFVSFISWNWNHSILFPFIHDRMSSSFFSTYCMSSSGKVNWTMLILGGVFFTHSLLRTYAQLAYINSS